MTSEHAHKRVLVGGSWLIGARVMDRLIGIISISILARLLKPPDFGLVAVASTVVAGVELLSAFGFDWALVRHHEPSADDLNSAWTLRVLFGALTFVVLTLLGPVAASFYHQAAMRPVLMAMGAASFVGSLENIGTVFFRREFAFHKEFLIRSASKLVGFLVTVGVALEYHSFWALVVGVFCVRCVTVAASYLFHPYRPYFSLLNARVLFGFSTWLLLGNIIEYCREKFADLYIGRVFGPSANGLFAVAGEISIVPITEIASPINRAAYSKYTEDVRNGRDLGPSYISIAALIWLISLPMAAGTVSVAPEVIRLLLGPQWHAAEPVLRWLAVGTAFTVMAANTHYVYWALGHTRVVAALSLVGAAIIVPVTVVCARFAGYPGVAFAFALASALVVPINFMTLRRLAGIRFSDLWRRVWRIAFGAIVMAIVLWLTFNQSDTEGVGAAAIMLALKVVCGFGIYTALVVVTWVACGRPPGPERAAMEMLKAALKKFSKKLP